MIKGKRGNHGEQRRRDCVGGIVLAPKPRLQHSIIDTTPPKVLQRQRCERLESRQGKAEAVGLVPYEGHDLLYLRLGDGLVIDHDPLPKGVNVWRGEETHGVPPIPPLMAG